MNSALERMKASTANLWIGFTLAMVVSGVLALMSLTAPLLFPAAIAGFALSNFLLLGAIFSSVMLRHAEVVAETGRGWDAAAKTPGHAASAPLTESTGTRHDAAQVTLPVQQTQNISPSLPTTAEPEGTAEQGQALSGPVDFSAYPEGQITMITRRLKQLSPEQRLAWDRAGRPNLSKWSGDDFDSWIGEA